MKNSISKSIAAALIGAALAVLQPINTQAQGSDKSNTKMKIQDIYTVLITKDIEASQKFYSDWFGFVPIFESSFFVLLTTTGERPISLGLLSEKHPSSPPSAPALNSKAGVFLTFQTPDAKAEYERLKKAGVKMYYELKDEAWGQRRFGVLDPNGMYVDIVEQTEPQPGFWDKYIK